MSKCPDAKDCLHDLILPTMQKVGDKVDFRLSYIGNATDHDDGVECKHGQEECLGNIIELCAMEKYPDPKICEYYLLYLLERCTDGFVIRSRLYYVSDQRISKNPGKGFD